VGFHFEDATGERWELDVSVQTVIDCRKELQVDLYGDARKIFRRIEQDDVEFTANLLYVVCKDKIEERGLSDRDFGRRLKDEVIYVATKEFFRALADFFRGQRGNALRKAIDGAERAEKRLTEKLRAALADVDVDAEIDRVLDAEFAKLTSSNSLSSSAEKSESIPGH
jgi:hypothetical protein